MEPADCHSIHAFPSKTEATLARYSHHLNGLEFIKLCLLCKRGYMLRCLHIKIYYTAFYFEDGGEPGKCKYQAFFQ